MTAVNNCKLINTICTAFSQHEYRLLIFITKNFPKFGPKMMLTANEGSNSLSILYLLENSSKVIMAHLLQMYAWLWYCYFQTSTQPIAN